MTMQHLESEFRRQGKGSLADIIASVHKLNDSDIPLPSVATPVERQTPKTPEAPIEIKRFSDEARKALEKQGYIIYGLTGQSIKTQKEAGRPFWSTWHRDYPDFEALGSMHSEVAINPNKLFLPKSNNKTLAQQEDMVSKFSEELGKKVKGVKAIIGQAPDYEELAFAHFDATGERLFGAKYNYDYAITKTPTGGSVVAVVGHFDADLGLRVDRWRAGAGNGLVHAAPLVVPV